MGDPVASLLASIEALGGRLVVVDGVLEFKGPVHRLSPELRAEISRLKPQLLAALRPRPITDLCARLADYGVYSATDAAGFRLVAHKGTPQDVLPPELLAEALSRAAELEEFARRPLERITQEELTALGFGTKSRLEAGLRLVDRALRPIEGMIRDFDRQGVRFLLYSEGDREQLAYLEAPGASISRLPEPLLRELLAREKEAENFVRSKGWRWTEPGAPMGGPTQ